MKKVAFFLTLTFPLISFVMEEFYPYSSVSMFSFTVDEVYQFEVLDSNNNVHTERFPMLQISNCCDPKVTSWGRFGYGAKTEESLLDTNKRAPYGVLPDFELAQQYVLNNMKPSESLWLELNRIYVDNSKVKNETIDTRSLINE